MELSEIHFHDCELVRVVEITATDDLLFEVDDPVDWENNRFEPRVIASRDVLDYHVEEGPFSGTPTLLDAFDDGPSGERRQIRIHTNAGVRSLCCAHVDLLPPGT